MKGFKKKRKLSKQELRFLPVLSQQTVYVKEASAILCKMMESCEAKEWNRCEREIKQYEVKGDAMLSEFYSTFYETDIPLLNRNDMQVIAQSIDVFLDNINSAAKSILLYEPKQIESQFVEMARYIERAANVVQMIIKAFEDIPENFTFISHQCESITEIEHASDEVYEEYISEIFRTEKDAINLVKNKNMAEIFEATMDAAKDFSDNIRLFLLRFL